MEKERHIRLLDYILKGIGIDEVRKIEEETKIMFYDYHTWIPYKYEEHDKSEPGYNVLMNLAEMYETMHINIFKKVNEMVTKKGFLPLFENPNDFFASKKQFDYLMKYRVESECNEIIGCESYDDYVSTYKLSK